MNLNLACGPYYSTSPEWINVDFSSSSHYVQHANLLEPLPFKASSFNAIYCAFMSKSVDCIAFCMNVGVVPDVFLRIVT